MIRIYAMLGYILFWIDSLKYEDSLPRKLCRFTILKLTLLALQFVELGTYQPECLVDKVHIWIMRFHTLRTYAVRNIGL